MKQTVLLFVLLGLCFMLVAQSSPSEPSSKIKDFLGNTGTLMVKIFYSAGTHKCQYGSKLSFDAVKITDATSKNTIKGLKIEAIEPGSYGDKSVAAFLDVDEVSALVEALNYMVGEKTKFDSSGLPYTEYQYTAKDAFQIGFFYNEGKLSGFAKVGVIGSISLFFPFADLPAILAIVNSAQAKLGTI